MSSGNSGNFSSQMAKADKGKDRSRQRKLVAGIASQEGIDEETRAELIARAQADAGGKNRRAVGGLLSQAVEGTNPTFNERYKIQTMTRLARERPGISGLLGR